MRIVFLLCCLLAPGLNTHAQDKGPQEKIDYHFKQYKKYRESDQKKRLWHVRKALSIAEKHNIVDKKAEAQVKMGSYFFDRAEIDSAEFYVSEGLSIFNRIKDKSGSGVALMYVSNIEKYKGNFVKAIHALTEADSLFKLDNQLDRRIQTNVSISTILARQEEFQKAILYLKRAEAIGTDDPYIKGVIYNNLAAYYGHLHDFDNSYINAKKAIRIKKALKDQKGLCEAYINLSGIITNEYGATQEVFDLLNEALEGYKSIQNNHGVVKCYLGLGISHRKKKEYTLSEHYLLLALKESQKLKSSPMPLRINYALHELYVDMKNWELAYSYYVTFKTIEDSLNSLEKTKIIQDLQTKYDTKEYKRESELAKVNEQLSEEKAKRSQNMSILTLSIGIICVLTLLFVYFQYRQRKKKEVLELQLEAAEKRLELEQQNRLSELKALQSQMNPHFVFNSLNSIQDLILQNDRRNSIHYLGKLSELTRKILEQSDHELISLAEEIETIQLYANLEKLRFGEELTFNVTHEIDSEESENCLLPAMFIQPYIENAFKHGLIHKEGKKVLTVHFQKEGDLILCIIEDNGIGRKRASEISERRNGQHLSFSTRANTQRIDLLNQQEENHVQLEIIDKRDGEMALGTIVKIYFHPIRKQGNEYDKSGNH